MIRKGIPGIRKIRETNRRGWHVFVVGLGIAPENEYRDYFDLDFETVVHAFHADGKDLIFVTGNGLTFTADRPELFAMDLTTPNA